MLQVGCAPLIVSITFAFCSRGKVERRNCSEIAITGRRLGRFALCLPPAVMCPDANFKAKRAAARNSPAAMEEMAGRTWAATVKSTTSENLQRTMPEPFDIPVLLDKTMRATWPGISSPCL